jgi:hypothetical protein
LDKRNFTREDGRIAGSLMEQLVEFLTHLKGNTLDMILTSILERVMKVTEEVPRED